MEDKFALFVECGFLKPATSVVMGDIEDSPCCISSVGNLAIHLGDCLVQRSTGSSRDRHTHPAAAIVIKKTFLHVPTVNATMQNLSDLLKPVFSPCGHNQREDEEALILNWHNYLKDVEGGLISNCACRPCICMHTVHMFLICCPLACFAK